MKLTTKGRYAVTAMLDIAYYDKGKPISLAEISSRQNISLSYLEQLFSRLKKKRLVESIKGPGGGYKLSKDASDLWKSYYDSYSEIFNISMGTTWGTDIFLGLKKSGKPIANSKIDRCRKREK